MAAYADTKDLAHFANADSDLAALVLDLASGAVDEYVRRPLREDTESRVLPATHDRVLWIVPAAWPLTVESVTTGDTTLAEGQDYRVRADGALWRADGQRWDTDTEVTYQTGFAEDSPELLTAKRITLELAARAVANPQLLDALQVDGASPSFVVRDGQSVLPQLALSVLQRQSLEPLRWRVRVA